MLKFNNKENSLYLCLMKCPEPEKDTRRNKNGTFNYEWLIINKRHNTYNQLRTKKLQQ